MLKLTRMVPQTREFDQWFDEVREMMHREVDYDVEAATTRRFGERLKDDERYIVPTIVDEYCTNQVLCMTFERGVPINSPVMLSLPQERRNQLGEASLEIAVREIFEWGEMQTDPNFGNYLVRLGNGQDIQDKIVLLDFGAIRQFDEHLLSVARQLIQAGYQHNKDAMVKAMTGYEFFDAMPESIKPGMADVFYLQQKHSVLLQITQICPLVLWMNTNVMTGRKASFIAVLCNKLVNQWLHVIFQFRQKSLCLLAVNSLEPTFMTVIDAKPMCDV